MVRSVDEVLDQQGVRHGHKRSAVRGVLVNVLPKWCLKAFPSKQGQGYVF